MSLNAGSVSTQTYSHGKHWCVISLFLSPLPPPLSLSLPRILQYTPTRIYSHTHTHSHTVQLTIPFQSVEAITKEKTALVIPNAIQISTSADKYGFSSLVNRDITYNVIFKCWQNSLLDHVQVYFSLSLSLVLRHSFFLSCSA